MEGKGREEKEKEGSPSCFSGLHSAHCYYQVLSMEVGTLLLAAHCNLLHFHSILRVDFWGNILHVPSTVSPPMNTIVLLHFTNSVLAYVTMSYNLKL